MLLSRIVFLLLITAANSENILHCGFSRLRILQELLVISMCVREERDSHGPLVIFLLSEDEF